MTSDTDAEDDGSFPTDYEIADAAETEHIADVVEPFGLDRDDLELYGEDKAKVRLDAIEETVAERDADGKLVLVTGMTPTPLGEGKTVTTVGLGQAFNRIGKDALVAIREPSLGPVFGVKGGAAGGGYSQVLPMEDINLHFTGDLHALTTAHNLISTMLDNHIKQGNELDVAVNWVNWPRAMDMNDRVLRETVIGLGGDVTGVPREDGFILTAASELMAVLCLADSLSDLKERVARIIVAYDDDGDPITVDDIDATGAVTILLKDAIKPNVVQTIEGTPAFVHGGPFANIAHGTNSLMADRLASHLSEYLVTEAGFGSDLGAEKFMNIVCRFGEMEPDAVTLVASVRALKYHGQDMWPPELEELEDEDVAAVERGFENLDKHVRNLQQFGVPVVVAINRFPGDTDAEVQAVIDHCEEDLGIRVAESNVFSDGGAGGEDLAEQLVDAAESDSEFEYLYEADVPIKEKIETIATEIYGADGVEYHGDAEEDIERLTDLGFDDMPVCMSKTFHSLSDDPSRKGAPEDWTLEVTEVYPSTGAGFLVVLTGDVLTLPGLPAEPAAAGMDIDEDGTISGLF
ncbi:formate--tetrahydrofolate ligase [Halopenitus persicus]|uniref:Formate--tetrahydrofolate ligase n=1 Tax=Halopenitus persicus TaxID=1048396 RepID=A0A1H3ETM7_9EURY|nr:formate--tetrahydrofolate ligase [Halopenitus persicus]QHS17668.1 formate--tetrahydrofolate ligase [haloarchaeon 3A1-DGR]SDX81279.1 Formate-tetrahydrofolate ligase [Halopenitus persicus]